MAKKKWTQEDVELLKELYINEGMQAKDIAIKFGVVTTAVQAALGRYGITRKLIKEEKILTRRDVLRVIKDYKNGYKIKQIANRLEVHYSVIAEILKNTELDLKRVRLDCDDSIEGSGYENYA